MSLNHQPVLTFADIASAYAEPMDVNEKRANNITRHQAVFSIDYATWQALIKAFDIKEPMIPHRDETEQVQVGSRGWYA